MNQQDEKKSVVPKVPKENIWGAWILILALLIIPVVVKYLFFNDN